MRTATIIVNRRAGGIRTRPELVPHIQQLCTARSAGRVRVELPEDVEQLRAACRRCAQSGVDVVGVIGGDGTASLVLSELWRAYEQRGQPLPRIAFLRGGTMNTIANSLGIARRSALQMVELLLVALTGNGHTPRIGTRPTLRAGERLGYLFGTGVWSGYLAESYRDGPPTRTTNAKVLGRVFASAAVGGETYRRVAPNTRLSARFEGGEWAPYNYLSIAAGTVADAGFGFRPFHRALQTQAAFQILAIKGGALELLLDMPRIWLGGAFREQTAHNTVTRWAELTADTDNLMYSVDGDVLVTSHPLRLELGPIFEYLYI